ERADYITVPIPDAKKAYYPEFHDKIKVIPQGFNISERPILPKVNNSIPQFAYAGVFYEGIRDPRMFMEFLSKVDVEFKFHIYTKDDTLIKEYYEKLGHKLIVKNYIPRKDLIVE